MCGGGYFPFSSNIEIAKDAKAKINLNGGIQSNVNIRVRENAEFLMEQNVFLNSNVTIICRKKIHIGEGTIIGPNTVIVDHDHDYRSDNRAGTFILDEIVIGKNVWIGGNVTILKGTAIGDNSVIGAGTVVCGKVNANAVVTGTLGEIKRYIPSA